MKYLLLIYTEDDGPQGTPEEQAENMKAWFDYTGDMIAAGVHVAGDALLPTTTATSVRVRDGQRTTTDGPFAETKEVLGGYYLIDVPSLDEALAWAEKCPAALYGTIEVRPVAELPEAP
ncbi:MAG: YciI family protein [Nitriliruptorales bacterium]|nr:YciI family protein [Nitriliruptorales bacterium]